MPTCKYLVLLETSGNQEYLFATNRLQENVGASELTYQVGTKFVLEAIRCAGGPAELADYKDTPGQLRQLLSKHTAQNGIEVIIATSGKALFLTSDFEVGRQIIAAATRRALRDAPGLDLFGMISEPFDWETESVHDHLETLYQRFESLRGSQPQPAARFPMLPVCEPCASSGLPAWGLDTDGDPVSWQSWQKRQAAKGWRDRIIRILQNQPKKHWVEKRLDHLEQLSELDEDFTALGWTAVMHADGNGFGKIFRKLPCYLNGKADSAAFNERYVNALRRLSLALEEATEKAFCEALKVLPKITKRVRVKSQKKDKPPWKNREILPIVPLVLGGDDLTVMCEGRHALAFTRTFLEAFEKQTERTDLFGGIAPEIAKKIGSNHLSACAGVAITKPHFPFYSGYTLAEQLLRSAKTIKQKIQQCSAMDFHVLYDASFAGLDAIRRRLLQDNGTTALTAKPYVVTNLAKLEAVDPDDWAASHHVQDLWERVQVINARDEEGRRKLPNSQLHALREALSMGHLQADARLRLIRHRYPDLGKLLDNSASLFRETGESDPCKPCRETRFLDALDSAEFWKEHPHDDAANTDQ